MGTAASERAEGDDIGEVADTRPSIAVIVVPSPPFPLCPLTEADSILDAARSAYGCPVPATSPPWVTSHPQIGS